MTVIGQRAIRAQPPDPGAQAWCQRERELIEQALSVAHGMQGAPKWYDFLEYVLDRVERQYPSRKESVVRNEWRKQLDLTVDEFEWGIEDTNSSSRSEIDGLGGMCCDECGTFSANLYGFCEKGVCEHCWSDLGFEEQASLDEFGQIEAPAVPQPRS